MLKFKQSDWVGVDMAVDAIKIMVLTRHAQQLILKNFAALPLPRNSIVDQQINQPEQVVQVIKDTLTLAKCEEKNAIIALPTAMVTSQFIQMEADLTEAELEAEIGFEVEKYIPQPLENISLDFQILGKTTKDPHKINVLLVATLSRVIQERVAILQEAGLTAAIVDVESYALQRAAALSLPELADVDFQSSSLLLDLNTIRLSFTMIQQAQVIYTYEQVYHDAQNPDAIQLQIHDNIQRITTSALPQKIAHIVLSGQLELLPAIIAWLQSHVDIPICVADPLKHLQSQVDGQLSSQQSTALMVVTGLALRGLKT